MISTISPLRLWSLWDMLKVYANEFFSLGECASTVRSDIYFGDSTRKLPDFQKTEVSRAIAALSDLCTKIGLTTSLTLLKARENNLPETKREWELLVDAVRSELKSNFFLFVPSHRAKYYEMTLQDEVTTRFPGAAKELVAAGNSLATGLFTACVFHAMRGAEIGVRVLGKTLGVAFPDKPLELAEWQNILDQSDSKIVAMKALPRGTHKDEEVHFYSQAAVQFRYFKDAWRVRVAHARETYEVASAIRILDHTTQFFDTLATRLREE